MNLLTPKQAKEKICPELSKITGIVMFCKSIRCMG